MVSPVRTLPSPPPRAGEEPPEPPQPRDVAFSYNPQDRVEMQPGERIIRQVLPGPTTERLHLREELEPNKEGAYVYPRQDPRVHRAVAFSAAARAVELFEQAYGKDFGWAFRGKLEVVADGDREWLNAYYSRFDGSVNFFHADDPITGRTVRSGHSLEVVAHEVGHAILDGLRPQYLGAWSPDVGAFHESFGDMMALLTALQDERVLQRVAVQTGGDLSKPNVAAAMAEELGQGINDTRGSNVTGGDWVRNAINDFVWKDPDELPWRGGPDELGREPHSFSRLWTGAFYDVIRAIADENLQSGMEPVEALRAAGREGLTLLANLMKEAPRGTFTYRDMAEAFVRSDREHNEGRRAALIEQVYRDRRILPAPEEPPPQEPALPTPAPIFADEPVRKLRVTLSGPEFGPYQGAVVEVPVDPALGKDAELYRQTQKQLLSLIRQGRIRWNDPNYRMKLPEDAFDPHGEPYIGAVTWENGQMKIERLPIAT